MMKKVLLVSPLPPPVGGIATWTKHILNSFKQDSEVEILHYNTAMQNRRITQLTILQRVIFGIQDMMNNVPKIVKCAKQNSVDVVHITSSASLGLYKDNILITKLNKIGAKTVVHFRFGRIPILAKSKKWEWKILCRVIKKAAKVVVIDINSYNTLVDCGFTNIEYIPNPISQDIENLCRKNNNPFDEREHGKLLFVGHVTINKGVTELIEVASMLDLVKEVILIGPYEEEYRKSLEKIAQKRDDGKWLQFLGSQPIEVVLKNMAECNIFTLPSYTEGFPNVILESMIMECPIVTTSVGAIDDMLDIKSNAPCGVCVEPKNVEQLKEALQNLINDNSKAETMGRRAKAKVLNDYTISIVKNSLIALWKSTITKY